MNWRFWPLRKKIFHTLGQSRPLSPFRPFGHLSVHLDLLICLLQYFINSIEIGLEKYDWTASSEIRMKMWSGRGGQIGGARWPNRGKGDRGLLWPSVWKNFFQSGQILQFTHDLFQFCKAFVTKNFVGWENDSQSWNPCFLGVRSPVWLFKSGGDPVYLLAGCQWQFWLAPSWHRGEYFYLSRSQWLLHYFFFLVQLYLNQVFRAEILVRNSSA